MRILHVLITTAAILLAATAHAHAGPVAAAVAGVVGAISSALAAGGITAVLIKAGISIALNYGISLLQRALAPEQKQPGIQTKIEVGGNNPISFIAGWYATAGQLEYANTWGSAGDTPNAYLTMIISLSDLPASALRTRIWVNGKACTINTADASYGEQGFPVTEFLRGADDNNLWIKFNDGTQTEADPFAVQKLAALERPWITDMIGRGIAYAIVTAQYQRKLFTGPPQIRFEVEGIKLYDIRKDGSEGGVGSHRWSDPETWEYSENPVVIIYNILRGIYYDGEWIYGLQNLPASRLPMANWAAAMNECDVLVDLADGGTEKQFRAGIQIRADIEPFDAIEELLKTCNGRLAEIGGIYKIMVGAPGLSVFSFTDEDIVVTQGQSYEPFPGLESTHNGIHASYPEPDEAWEAKDAPPRYNADYETADGNRRLIANVSYAAAPYGTQVQRLMVSMIEEERRFRRHVITLPPDAWLLEPNDTVSWTSVRNSYTNKKFLVVSIDGPPGMNQAVGLKEIDPSDYVWDPESELPTTVGPTGPLTPPTQAFTGWQAFGTALDDNDGTARRASILVTFPGLLADVESVRVQVKLADADDDDLAFDSTIPYGDPLTNTNPKAVVLNGSFIATTDYEVRGLLIPFSARDTEWSGWIEVTTPFIADETDVQVGLGNLQEDIATLLIRLQEDRQRLRGLIEQVAADSAIGIGRQIEQTSVVVRTQNALASSLIQLEAEIGENLQGEIEALAEAILGVEAQVGTVSAGGLISFVAQVPPPSGILAQINVLARADTEEDFVETGLIIQVYDDAGTIKGYVTILADRFVVSDGSLEFLPLVFEAGTLKLNVADIGQVTAGTLQSPDGTMVIDLDNGTIEIFA